MIAKLKFAATMLAVRLAGSLFITPPLSSFSVKTTASFNEGDGYEKVKSRCLKLDCAYRISFNQSDVDKFFWS